MIVVLSYEGYEQGTEYVIDWLAYYRANFMKITMKDFFNKESKLTLDVNGSKLLFQGKNIADKVNVIFNRRLFADFEMQGLSKNIFKTQIEKEVTGESFALINYLFYLFRDRQWLPSPGTANVNKLIMINTAAAAGLQVPKTRVMNTKTELLSFQNSCKNGIITKPIAKSSYYICNKFTYFANVNKLNEEDSNALPDAFFPSLFQEAVEKEYEIRVFYLDGEFYSLALLYTSEESYMDIKLNNEDTHTHWVVYQLPKKIETQIDTFMKSIRLNTGSLDIVKAKNGDYIFIEVNPVGQYGHGSFFGNFHLEKVIAEWLIKKDKQYGKRN
jgi:hypothetical protein